MTIAKLDEMEARVDIGEIDIVLIQEDQVVRIEVDSFKDQEVQGHGERHRQCLEKLLSQPQGTSRPQPQEAPKFEVKIRCSITGDFVGRVGDGGNRNPLPPGRPRRADPERHHAAAKAARRLPRREKPRPAKPHAESPPRRSSPRRSSLPWTASRSRWLGQNRHQRQRPLRDRLGIHRRGDGRHRRVQGDLQRPGRRPKGQGRRRRKQ